MSEKKQTFEEWAADQMKAMGVEEIPKPAAVRICNCGSCQEALEVTMRAFEQLAENHCILWSAQVAAVWSGLTRASLMHYHPNDFNEVYREIETEMATHLAQKPNWDKYLDMGKRLIALKSKRR